MKCPKCRTVDLSPAKLEDGLPAMGCPQCEGAALSILYYREWAERNQPVATDAVPDSDVVEDSDTRTAMACPKCSRLMTKFAITGSLRNRIDLCGSCDEAWLDHGEWGVLKTLELANRLPKVFTEQWQRKVRTEKREAARMERLQDQVGEGDAARAEEVRNWLKSHPRRGVILQFLSAE